MPEVTTVNLEYANMFVLGIVFVVSLIFHLTQHGTLAEPNAGFRRTALAFWTWALGFALITFLLLALLPKTGARDFTVVFSQIPNNINSILFFGVYSVYTRGRTFSFKEFAQVWGTVLLFLTIWEMAWEVQLQSSNGGVLGVPTLALDERMLRVLMCTPSTFLSMLSAFGVGWSFLRRLGASAILFPVFTALWGIVQILAYTAFIVEQNAQNDQMKNIVWLSLICLRIPIAIMFLSYVQVTVSPETIIQPPEMQARMPEVVKRIIKIVVATVAVLLALNGLWDLFDRLAP